MHGSARPVVPVSYPATCVSAEGAYGSLGDPHTLLPLAALETNLERIDEALVKVHP